MPVAFRSSLLAQGFELGMPTIDRQFASADGTERYLIRFGDGQTVETVWMPEGDGGEQGDGSGQGEGRSRATICLSSQAGCAVNCGFCMTALLGLQRNLTAGEIVGQVLLALARPRG